MKTIPRRLVTGIKEGKSLIVEDAISNNVSEHFIGLIISDIWSTHEIPVSLVEEKKYLFLAFIVYNSTNFANI